MRLDHPTVGRWLAHSHRSRLARSEAARRDIGPAELARLAGVTYSTARRFLGTAGNWKAGNVRDPRTSTTMRMLAALGYKCEWRRVPEQSTGQRPA